MSRERIALKYSLFIFGPLVMISSFGIHNIAPENTSNTRCCKKLPYLSNKSWSGWFRYIFQHFQGTQLQYIMRANTAQVITLLQCEPDLNLGVFSWFFFKMVVTQSSPRHLKRVYTGKKFWSKTLQEKTSLMVPIKPWSAEHKVVDVVAKQAMSSWGQERCRLLF